MAGDGFTLRAQRDIEDGRAGTTDGAAQPASTTKIRSARTRSRRRLTKVTSLGRILTSRYCSFALSNASQNSHGDLGLGVCDVKVSPH
jgi:hypothetical protein